MLTKKYIIKMIDTVNPDALTGYIQGAGAGNEFENASHFDTEQAAEEQILRASKRFGHPWSMTVVPVLTGTVEIGTEEWIVDTVNKDGEVEIQHTAVKDIIGLASLLMDPLNQDCWMDGDKLVITKS